MSNLKKANWIATQLEANEDDVYDILLGNLATPKELVREVLTLEFEYDILQRKHNDKI